MSDPENGRFKRAATLWRMWPELQTWRSAVDDVHAAGDRFGFKMLINDHAEQENQADDDGAEEALRFGYVVFD